MINVTRGLVNSLVVLEFLRNKESLQDISIYVGAFTNCREVGLTFTVSEQKSFTWCIYEHRNSDEIIINGKEGFISLAGDLPYKSDSKWDVIKAFKYNEHYQCAEHLEHLILDFFAVNKRP